MPDATHRLRFEADRGDARLRLDQVLVRRVTEVSRLSRNLTQRWIALGLIEVDGVTVARPSARVREGASVTVRLPASTVMRERPEPEAGDLTILYEDAWLLAVNKPPGVVVHPSYKQHGGTLLNKILWRVRERPDARPGVLTRLDKDTSGVVVVALTSEVHAQMQRDGAQGSVLKTYLTLVRGRPAPPSGRIDEALARDPLDRRRVVVAAGGAASETRFRVRSTRDDISLVECELVTGRTHQIRVHMAARGWPVLGDRVYGAPDPRIARQALHAWRITLPHPSTRERLEIEAPLAPDLQGLLAATMSEEDVLRLSER